GGLFGGLFFPLGGLPGDFGRLFGRRGSFGTLGGGLLGGGLGLRSADRRQNPVNFPRDLFDGHHAVDRDQLSAFRIIVDQRFRQRPVLGKALGQHLGGVVDPDV